MSITLRSCLVSLSLLSIAACGGTQGADASASREIEAPQAKPLDKPAASRPGPGGAAAAVGMQTTPRRKALSSRPILELLPKDRSIVVHLSWRLIEASEVFAQYRDLFTKSVQPYVGYVIDACGLDPMDEIDSVTLALGSDPQRSNDTIIAVTLRIGRSQVEDCIRKTGGTIEEGKYLFKGDSFHVHWADPGTLLLAEKMSAKEMDTALAKGRATDSESLMEFLRKTDSHAAIWGGGVLPAGMAGLMAGSGVAMPRGLHGSLNAWSGIDAAIGLAFQSNADAISTLSMLQMAIQMMGSQPAGTSLSNAVQMQQVGNQITIDLVLAAPELAKIIDASK